MSKPAFLQNLKGSRSLPAALPPPTSLGQLGQCHAQQQDRISQPITLTHMELFTQTLHTFRGLRALVVVFLAGKQPHQSMEERPRSGPRRKRRD